MCSASATSYPDPRSDDLPDSFVWGLVLAGAYRIDGDDPCGVFGALHGIRCLGADLEVSKDGIRIIPGELAAEYSEIRTTWLLPHAETLTNLLANVSSGLVGYEVSV
jgi:hypothetical protein